MLFVYDARLAKYAALAFCAVESVYGEQITPAAPRCDFRKSISIRAYDQAHQQWLCLLQVVD